MKDKRTHYGAIDKSYMKHQICGNVSISFIVRKTGPIHSPLVGLMAGWQMKYRWILKV